MGKGLIFVMLLMLSAIGSSKELIQLNEIKQTISLVPSLETFSTLNDLTIDQVLSKTNQFHPVHSQTIVRLGVTNKTHWFQSSIFVNGRDTQQSFMYFDDISIGQIELYVKQNKGIYHLSSGGQLPRSERASSLINYGFDVPLKPGMNDIYFSVNSKDAMDFNVFLGDKNQILLAKQIKQFAVGGLVFLTLAVSLLCLYFAIKYKTINWRAASLISLVSAFIITSWSGNVSLLLPNIANIDFTARNSLSVFYSASILWFLRPCIKLSSMVKRSINTMIIALFIFGIITFYIPFQVSSIIALIILTATNLIAHGFCLIKVRSKVQSVYWFWAGLSLQSVTVIILLLGVFNLAFTQTVSFWSVSLLLTAFPIFVTISQLYNQQEKLHSENPSHDAIAQQHWPLLRKLNHDLRGPINGVLGMSELLLDTSLSANQQEYLNTVQTSGYSLLTQVDEIQNLTRIGTNKLPLKIEQFDLHDMLEELVSPYARMAQSKGIELVVDVGSMVPDQLKANRKLLFQVLRIVLDNAVNYTETGEIIFSLSILSPGKLDIELKDTGSGIIKEFQQRIFEFPQYRQNTKEQVHLGLPIAKAMVNKMGGLIEIDSQNRTGTKVRISVPALIVPIEQTNQQHIAELGNIKALIVDDNLSCRKVLEHQCASLDIQAISVSNGQTALANLHNEFHKGKPFDVILLDHNMPNITGVELAKKIREDSRLNSDITIVMLTGVDIGQAEWQPEDYNIEFVLNKPISTRDLQHVLLKARSSYSN